MPWGPVVVSSDGHFHFPNGINRHNRDQRKTDYVADYWIGRDPQGTSGSQEQQPLLDGELTSENANEGRGKTNHDQAGLDHGKGD